MGLPSCDAPEIEVFRADAPSATDFEGRQFALPDEAVDGCWMQAQKIRDFDYRQDLSALRHRVVLLGEAKSGLVSRRLRVREPFSGKL